MIWPLCWRSTLDRMRLRLIAKHTQVEDLGRENTALRVERSKYRQFVLAQRREIEDLRSRLDYYQSIIREQRSAKVAPLPARVGEKR